MNEDPMKLILKAERHVKTVCGKKLKVGVIVPNFYERGISVQRVAVLNRFERASGSTPDGDTLMVPARDFLMIAMRKHASEWRKAIADAFKMYGPNVTKTGAYSGWSKVGRRAASDMKKVVFDSSNFAPNAPSTKRRKHSTKPLLDTRLMVNSISFRISDASPSKRSG